jgi:hypothetical protein
MADSRPLSMQSASGPGVCGEETFAWINPTIGERFEESNYAGPEGIQAAVALVSQAQARGPRLQARSADGHTRNRRAVLTHPAEDAH